MNQLKVVNETAEGYGDAMKLLLSLLFFAAGCSTTGETMKTVKSVEIPRFMGKWYVLAGRFTFLEKDVHNGVESYAWKPDKEQIDVEFTYNKGSFAGPQKSIPQKAWIHDKVTHAHWKVSPLWPFKLDYLIVALDPEYRWTAVGVPNQNYLWIMARDWRNPEHTIDLAIQALNQVGYNTQNLVRVPQQWPTD